MSIKDGKPNARFWRWVHNPVAEGEADPQPLHERLAVLKAYYDTVDLYARLRWGLERAGAEADLFEDLRSPAFEAVEFHVGHWFPGGDLEKAFAIRKDSALASNARTLVYDVMRASNWASKKQTFARTVCWSGNGFIRIGQRKSDGHPYKQVIEPQYAREFKTDERGFLTYFRYAVPKVEKKGRQKTTIWITYVFDKDKDLYQMWRRSEPLDDFDDKRIEAGRGEVQKSILQEWKIDFLPVVWCPFMETSPGRGTGVFEPFLQRIDNVNRAATRLHDMLFRYNRSVWALERPSLTPEGYEMPPVDLVGSFDSGSPGRANVNMSEDERESRWGSPYAFANGRQPDGTIGIGADAFANLPSNAILKSLVPQVDYAAALSIVNSDIDNLATVLPELLYNKAMESNARDSAGVVRNQLAGAIDRAVEAKGNAEQAIVRANQIALTIGQRQRVKGFEVVGRTAYEDGDLDFAFEEREILPRSDTEKAQARQVEAAALTEMVALFRALGYSTDPLKDEVARISGIDVNKLTEDPTQVALNSEGQAAEAGFEGTQSALSQLLGRTNGAAPARQGTGAQGGGTNGQGAG